MVSEVEKSYIAGFAAIVSDRVRLEYCHQR
jgi:hypothetical protein